jgi:hypothetical protein
LRDGFKKVGIVPGDVFGLHFSAFFVSARESL